MRRRFACWLSASFLLAVGCASLDRPIVETGVEVDPAMDFSTWRTYAWYPSQDLPVGNPRLDSPLTDARLERSIDRALAERGFERIELGAAEPDFYAQFHLSTEQRLEAVEMNRGYGTGPYGRGWGGGGWGGSGWTEVYGFEYEVGTLVIDLVDVATRRIVWRGHGSRRLADQVDPEEMSARVDAAVREILAPFPPRDAVNDSP